MLSPFRNDRFELNGFNSEMCPRTTEEKSAQQAAFNIGTTPGADATNKMPKLQISVHFYYAILLSGGFVSLLTFVPYLSIQHSNSRTRTFGFRAAVSANARR